MYFHYSCLVPRTFTFMAIKVSKSAWHVETILDGYCNDLRQLVNFHESMVQFSRGLQKNRK